ncbi:MAG: hypothetical protein QXH30_01685 [Candidatus Bilamarchaeaceae archaeon]
MAEENRQKGGNFRDEILASRQEPRPVNKGRHAKETPLVEELEGRAARTNPRKASLLGGAVLSIGITAFAFGCDEGSNNSEIPDAGWDAETDECLDCPEDTDSDLVAEICGGEGSALSDNEALLAEGNSAVFTKAKHTINIVEVGEASGKAVARFLKPNGEEMENGHYGYEELTPDDPLVTVSADGETQTIALCGIEENSEGRPAARLATTREKGFVHCLPINSASDSVPIEHELDADTVEVLVANVQYGGEFAEDGDTEDCEPKTAELKKQRITFEDGAGAPASLTSRNLLLLSEAQTLKVHKLVGEALQPFEVDLYEVDGAAGTAKVGNSKLGIGTLGLGNSIAANEELRVTLNSFDGEAPDFSFSYIPDGEAQVWTTATANPNEVEVNVISGAASRTYVVRFSNNKGNDTVDVTVISKSALSTIGSGSECNLGGKIYVASVETDGSGITAIWLTPAQ